MICLDCYCLGLTDHDIVDISYVDEPWVRNTTEPFTEMFSDQFDTMSGIHVKLKYLYYTRKHTNFLHKKY